MEEMAFGKDIQFRYFISTQEPLSDEEKEFLDDRWIEAKEELEETVEEIEELKRKIEELEQELEDKEEELKTLEREAFLAKRERVVCDAPEGWLQDISAVEALEFDCGTQELCAIVDGAIYIAENISIEKFGEIAERLSRNEAQADR